MSHSTRVILAFAAALLSCVQVMTQAGKQVGRGQDQDQDLEQRSRQRFKRLDRNKDGKLSRAEFPQRMRGMFARIDSNGDGYVDLEEDIAFQRKRAQRGQRAGAGAGPRPTPTWANIEYGPHERNVLDLYLVESKEPTPLVVYIHGGGFRGGDKRSVSVGLLEGLLQKGVSMAAFNYRLSGTAPFPAQMHDCARALQFLRHHAKKYNIDPKRIGATGGSAGAGISQWLAFHEDLADPQSKDPILRQSTRLTAIVPYNAQSSYDPRFIQKLFDTEKVDSALIPFFGMRSPEDVEDEKFHKLFEEASPINHATADDPPVLMYFNQANKPLAPGSRGGAHIHHPRFGIVLKEKLDKLGVECTVLFREDHPRGTPTEKFVRFFLEKFGPGQSREKEDKKQPKRVLR